ncbi:winged helix-turn-helix domain-containing protein [Streptomyces sp. NPDC051776]|uniref:winged helix-turn-helix domain-containing protein n=1 Tax=Streptomyces sp. NPDC051776 TaxID=3155414 RepID=UPI003449D64D
MVTKKAQLEDTIRGWIASGELAPGDKLPSERTLEEEQGVGRTTVRIVLAKLAAEGLVMPHHGKGYFVASTAKTTGG